MQLSIFATVSPQERTFAPFRGWLCTLSMETHRDDRDIGKLTPVGAALIRMRSHILGFSHEIGCGIIALRRSNSAHLRRPSSSAVARQFGMRYRLQNPP